MTYTVYYSDQSDDLFPPSFWNVDSTIQGSNVQITVDVTDYSGIGRCAVAYTYGDGWWHTVDLQQSDNDPNIWVGTIPNAEQLTFFVQAVDLAGNVGVETNKSLYFGYSGVHMTNNVYLPLIKR